MESIERFGEPFIVEDGECLRVNVRKLAEVQVLFAFDGDELAGLLVYSRISHKNLVVIHIAVSEDYSSGGKFANKALALRISQQLRRCARQIKGVATIRMIYSSNRVRDYAVRGRES